MPTTSKFQQLTLTMACASSSQKSVLFQEASHNVVSGTFLSPARTIHTFIIMPFCEVTKDLAAKCIAPSHSLSNFQEQLQSWYSLMVSVSIGADA